MNGERIFVRALQYYLDGLKAGSILGDRPKKETKKKLFFYHFESNAERETGLLDD